ncbi:uncharacterized protein LOC142526757 [Primulina tabacum]|uniref:uncharacterized protein LOC142526757 n=1 Tax=Primulina tabacum TaxID=48773 RepID=UPI003F5A967E
MMLLQSCNFSSHRLQKISNNLTSPAAQFLNARKNSRNPRVSIRCVSELAPHNISLGNIADVLHNKVLVAAALSAAIGQLSKPFTSSIFCGKKFDFRAAVQAGGFPSTHSSAAVATATSLALDRGFSDAIFGLAVVYASLIMYDAQGVRREVGTHAKELNKVLLKITSLSMSSRNDAKDLNNSLLRRPSSNIEKLNLPLQEETYSQSKPINSSLLVNSDDIINGTTLVRSEVVVSDVEEGSETVAYVHTRLNESIGHTEIEVVAGALLGFLVSLAVCPYV